MLDPRFYFGYKKGDADIRFDADLQVGIKIPHSEKKKYILYDQF